MDSSKKIALVFICLNQRYWPYFGQVVKDVKQHFLTNHKVDIFAWTDIEKEKVDKVFSSALDPFSDFYKKAKEKGIVETLPEFLKFFSSTLKEFLPYNWGMASTIFPHLHFKHNAIITIENRDTYSFNIPDNITPEFILSCKEVMSYVVENTFGPLRNIENQVTIVPTEPIEWPIPTLMRYHLFLNEEEKLKEYDYIFYIDADMRIVSSIGEEIMGEGLTMAEHPMYAISKKFIPPYEPNKESSAYINRMGFVLEQNGQKWFKPLYAAGGFQGGKSQEFINAMKVMKENIDKDFNNNYVAIWNDESHWNKYLSEYKKHLTILTPSYVYPDSMIKEYFEPVWGRSYVPKIVTLTKHFTTSKEGGKAASEATAQLKNLK